jgi:hypothetical protein
MRVSLAAALLLSAAPALAFEATGEVLTSNGSSAAFDAEHVVGPVVNLTRQEGGSWTGELLGQGVDLVVTEDRIIGPNVDLRIERKKSTTAVRGHFFGKRYSVEWDAKGLSARVGNCSYDLDRAKTGGAVAGNVGCSTSRSTMPAVGNVMIKLRGEANSLTPPMPQFALALVATLAG